MKRQILSANLLRILRVVIGTSVFGLSIFAVATAKAESTDLCFSDSRVTRSDDSSVLPLEAVATRLGSEMVVTSERGIALNRNPMEQIDTDRDSTSNEGKLITYFKNLTDSTCQLVVPTTGVKGQNPPDILRVTNQGTWILMTHDTYNRGLGAKLILTFEKKGQPSTTMQLVCKEDKVQKICIPNIIKFGPVKAQPPKVVEAPSESNYVPKRSRSTSGVTST